MERIPLIGGSYASRSILASATRCINYYPEINPKDSATPFTYYQRPGLVRLPSDSPEAPVRGLYQASNGIGYCVIGSEVFRITPAFSLIRLGEITRGRSNPVSMADNGTNLVIGDGSSIGWQVALKGFEISLTGNVWNTNQISGLVGASPEGTNGLALGMSIVGTDIPAGAKIVDLSSNSLTMDKTGTATVAAFVASATTTVLTVSAVSSGTLQAGQLVLDSASLLLAGTKILAQLTGTPGGAGTYSLTTSQPVPISAEEMTATSAGGVEIVFSAAADFFSEIHDPTSTFLGTDKFDFIDTFIIWNNLGTDQLGSTLSGFPLSFDGTYFASKTDYPDLLETLIVNRHEIILFGLLKSEIWYDAGNPTFPFAELPGAFIEHGVVAKYSVASEDISVFWLGRDLQGSGVVFRQRGYYTTRISNHALEEAIRQIASRSTIADAIGYTYQLDGHVFYVLVFPSGDETWVFDDSIQDPMLAWHQEAWTDENGVLHRHRGNCFAALYGKAVVGDWENGALYEMSLDSYTDEVGGQIGPISFIRTFPLVTHGRRRADDQLAPAAGGRLQFTRFWADFECGNSPADVDGRPAMVSLRWSDDRGKTFGQTVLQSAGTLGEYMTQPQWPGLGIGRWRLFEISHSIAGAAALNGGWYEAYILDD